MPIRRCPDRPQPVGTAARARENSLRAGPGGKGAFGSACRASAQVPAGKMVSPARTGRSGAGASASSCGWHGVRTMPTPWHARDVSPVAALASSSASSPFHGRRCRCTPASKVLPSSSVRPSGSRGEWESVSPPRATSWFCFVPSGCSARSSPAIPSPPPVFQAPKLAPPWVGTVSSVKSGRFVRSGLAATGVIEIRPTAGSGGDRVSCYGQRKQYSRFASKFGPGVPSGLITFTQPFGWLMSNWHYGSAGFSETSQTRTMLSPWPCWEIQYDDTPGWWRGPRGGDDGTNQ